MRSLFRRALTLGGLAAACSSCLDISPPGTTFASEPPGALVRVDGRDTGWVTPCQIDLGAGEPCTVAIELEGYAPREFLLVPDERLHLITWTQGATSTRNTVRFPLFLPTLDLFFPLREREALSPGRVFVRLHPEAAP